MSGATINLVIFAIDTVSGFRVGVSFAESLCLKLVITLLCFLCDKHWVLKCRCYIKLYDSPLNSPAEEEDHTLKTTQKKKKKKQRKAERAKKVYQLVFIILWLCLFDDFIVMLPTILGGRGEK